MRIPDHTTPVPRCESLSFYAESAMTQYAEAFPTSAETTSQLRALASTLGRGRAALTQKQLDYREGVLACIAPRIGVMLTDLSADAVVRSAKRGADDAGKDVVSSVFPDGVTPIIRPVGQAEVANLHALEGRIQAAVSRWAEATAWHERIVSARTRYETALANRTHALAAAAAKRALRNAAREDFLDTYATTAAAIKALFPRDRALQDLFFEELRSAPSGDDEGGDDEPDLSPPAT